MSKFFTRLQHFIPHHVLTRFMGRLARCRSPWIKDRMIRYFIHKYRVDLTQTIIENPQAFTDFNDFFIRQLKPGARPLAAGPKEIASPADGLITEIGHLQQAELLQAKGFTYSLATLLGDEASNVSTFINGSFATFYLSPKDYHRVHMPLTGKLIKAVFIPGKLYSVNAATTEAIPHLYTRNERLITIFDTHAGPMAVILIGAMIVGSIKTVWMSDAVRAQHKQSLRVPPDFTLNKGDELGHFKMGSTVVLLFPKGSVRWTKGQEEIQYGQQIGFIL